ncbi:MAG: EamA family transporter [Candidatus Hydrogenedentes bacterium]|nr:EamA family transporter [Candidatus Hydrogenedentota bacterium]
MLVPYSLWFFGQETVALFRRPRGLLGLAAVNVVDQILWTIGCYHTTASQANLITKLQVAFVILFSFLFFREERAVIRSAYYLGGTALGILGVVAIVTAHSAASLLPRYDFATFLLIVVALGWAIYAVWGKHLVMRTHPVPMFTVVAVHSTVGFAVVACVAGDLDTVWKASIQSTLLAFVSGVFPIAIAHCTFHYGQKHLGSAFATSITLIGPLITYFLALLIWPDEKMAPVQWLGTAMLLWGSYLVVQAQRKRGTPLDRAPVAAPPE